MFSRLIVWSYIMIMVSAGLCVNDMAFNGFIEFEDWFTVIKDKFKNE